MTPMRRGRVPLMGVKRKFQRDQRGLFAPFMIIDALIKAAQKYGLVESECGWILEDNQGMRSIADAIQCTINKRYWIFEKTL